MTTTRRVVALQVATARGNQSDAEKVLDDVIDMINAFSMAYASVGEVKVTVREIE